MRFRVIPLHILFVSVFSMWGAPARAQGLEYLGLAGEDLTSLGCYRGIVAAGSSDGHGVHWRFESQLPGDWEGASGTYAYRLDTGGTSQSRRMILLR
jgi:hypothetical protein